MILDMNNQNSESGVMNSFPDFPFADLPKQPAQIKETIIICGSQNSSFGITGTLDEEEG